MIAGRGTINANGEFFTRLVSFGFSKLGWKERCKMAEKSGSVSPVLAAAIICLVAGGAAGYYGRYFTESNSNSPGSSSPPGARGGSGMGGGSGGGMGGMMGGGGGQQGPQTQLARLVRNLSTVEKVQGKGISSAQSGTLAPILKKIKSAEKLPEADAQARLDEINKVLTEDQKQALQALTPQRGGGGGGRGGGGGGMMGGAPPGVSGGPGGGGGGMMGGGAPPDPEKPFASERNKQALDDLMAKVGGGK
jgi:hypothetical protein